MKKNYLLILLLSVNIIFAAGVEPTGTPREVSTLDHLIWISDHSSCWGDSFTQTADIDASASSSLDGGAGFNPIGTSFVPFYGEYNGNGHIIENLTINRPSSNYIGLFGVVNEHGEIHNLSLINPQISGGGIVAALAGQVRDSSSTITNCSISSGSVSGGNYVGGLVGYALSCNISSSHSTANVEGTDEFGGVGGLIGFSYHATVTDCYNAGATVSGETNVGGLIGKAESNSAVSNSYSTANVEGTGAASEIGGVIGYSDESTVADCYNTGTTVSGITNVGGFIGKTINSSISGSYSTANVQASGTATYIGGLIGYGSETPLTNCYNTGRINGGSSKADYIGGLVGYNIGGSALISACHSTGEVKNGNEEVGGLVGYCTSNIETSYCTGKVIGKNKVGGLVGRTLVSGRSIALSYSTGEVIAEENAGGFVGYVEDITINNCYSYGRVSRITGKTSTAFGSFIGYNQNGTVEKCLTIGSVYYNGVANPTDKGFVGTNSGGTYSSNFLDRQASNQTSGLGATARFTPALKILTTYVLAGWDFRGEWHNGNNDYWALEPDASYNNSYPYFAREYAGVPAPTFSGDTYTISSLQDLMWTSQHPVMFSSSLSYHIQLGADIDASATASWSGGAGFTPIGNSLEPFHADVYGEGHIITGLTTNQSFSSGVGLIGIADIIIVSRISLINANMKGKDYVGGLIGKVESYDVISECKVTGTITADNYSGGMVGYAKGPINDSYSMANINRKSGSTENYFGTFVGYNEGGTISTCYSTGSVYYIGTTAPTDKGFVGYDDGGTYTNNFWDSGASNQSTATGATGKTTPEMKTLTTYFFANWDFRGENHNGNNDYWALEPNASYNDGYPYLVYEHADSPMPYVDIDNYMHISTLEELMWVSQHPSYLNSFDLKLDDDIDASATASWSGGAGFIPIGSSLKPFGQFFDGNEHTINGLTINQNFSDNVGLFGVIDDAHIYSLSLTDVNIIGRTSVGGIVGKVEGFISLSTSKVTGNITGNNYVGGIIGYNTPSSSSSSIENSYSMVDINRASGATGNYFGTFIGANNHNCTINKCYSTGSVNYAGTSSPTDKGFIGYDAGGTYTNNFWNSETSNQSTATGATAKTTTEMKDVDTFTDETTSGLAAAWDFETNPNDDVANANYWDIDPTGVYNSGYPFLNFENGSEVGLPVELTTFTAEVVGYKVILTWETATEVSNYKFEIEKTSDERDWNKIGTIKGAGNSNSIKQYSFEDNINLTGILKYRLKQIDIDGQFQYSDEIEISVTAPKSYVLEQNSPNPFNPSTNISFTIPEAGLVKINIYNILGEIVYELVNENLDVGNYNYQFDANNLPSGIYIYSISVNEFRDVKKMNLLK
jgi:hypothetical protein